MTQLRDQLQSVLGDAYTVERELGGGGMSHTFVAEERALGRRIVVKVLPAEMRASVSVERFRREIMVAARLQHPHIVPLLSTGEVEGLPFYTMPFVKGESLRAKVSRDGELSLNEAVRILRDVAAALAHAHAEGVVHRDIKPDNVILSGGVAVVTDFGVAKAMDLAAGPADATGQLSALTSLGLALGTPGYMSPEQATADPHADHRADLYSFGCMAYELLTGAPPFAGRPLHQVLAAHVNETPDSIQKRRPSIPPALAQLVTRCLEKHAADRPQNAEEVLQALDAMTTPTGGTSPTLARLAGSTRTRRPWLAVVAAVVIVVAVTTYVLTRSPAPYTVGKTSQLSAAPELEVDAAISPDGKFVAYSAGLLGKMHIYVRQVGGGRPVPLTTELGGTHRWPRWSPDGSRLAFTANDAIYTVPSLGGTPERIVEPEGSPLRTPAWSPDGKSLAYADERGLWVRAADGGAPRKLVDARGTNSPAWSPSGRHIAYVDENASYVTDIGNIAPSAIAVVPSAGGKPARLTTAKRVFASPVWGADGRSILFVSDAGGTRDVYQQPLRSGLVPAGDPVRLTTGLNAFSISLSADGTRLAYSILLLRSNVWSAPISAGAPTPASAARQVTTGSQVIESMSVSPDGKWLAYDTNLSGNQDIYKQAIEGGEPVQLTKDAGDDFGPSWSPDGREIAFYSVRTGTRDVFTMDADGRNVRPVTSGPSQDYFPDWSPDGRRLCFTGTATGAREVFVTGRGDDGRWSPPKQLTFGADRVSAYQRWSPDGRFIAYAHASGIALVSPNGSTPRILPDPAHAPGQFRSVAWGRDPNAVYYLAADAVKGNGIWAIPVAGGAPRLVLRLDGPGWVQRVQRFATDGARVYFTLASDEADVWVMELKR